MSVLMSLRPPFKLPNKPSYYYEIDRKRRSLKTADKAEAMRLFNAIKREYLAGRIHRINGECCISLGDFKKEYLSWAEQTQPKSSVNVDKYALEKLVAVDGNQVRLDRITARSIDKVIEQCRKDSNSTSTINCYIRHLKRIFKKAAAWDYLKASPFMNSKQIPKEQRPPAYLEQKNVAKFIAGIEDRRLRLLVTAYLSTGRRRRELLNLDWSDVDLERRRYYVRQQKTHLERWFPASDDFIAVLNEIGPCKRGKVFNLGHPDTVSKMVKAELRKAGHGKLRLHDLRHSFAVLFIQAEGGLRTLQELLGHAQYSTTEIYAHVAEDHLNEAINRVKLGPKLRVVK